MKEEHLILAAVGILGTLAGVLLTWLLKELAETFKLRYEDRQVKGQALADLLEIRHRFTAPAQGLKTLLSRMQLHPEEETQLRLEWNGAIEQLLSDNAALKTRFNATVDALARSAPILSFKLRSKDSLLLVSDWLRDLASLSPVVSKRLEPVMNRLYSEVDSNLKSICRSVACSYGTWTWCKVVWLFFRGIEPSIEMEKAMADLRQIIAESRGAAPPQPQAPPAPQ